MPHVAAFRTPIGVKPARVLSRLGLLWLAFALLVQGFAVQTHAHVGGDRDAVVAMSGDAVATPAVSADDKNAPAAPACPLCEEKALFGAYLVGGSIAIVPPAAVVPHPAPVSLALLTHNSSSHAWQSRAPPAFTI
jgi:hypothetical protein